METGEDAGGHVRPGRRVCGYGRTLRGCFYWTSLGIAHGYVRDARWDSPLSLAVPQGPPEKLWALRFHLWEPVGNPQRHPANGSNLRNPTRRPGDPASFPHETQPPCASRSTVPTSPLGLTTVRNLVFGTGVPWPGFVGPFDTATGKATGCEGRPNLGAPVGSTTEPLRPNYATQRNESRVPGIRAETSAEQSIGVGVGRSHSSGTDENVECFRFLAQG